MASLTNFPGMAKNVSFRAKCPLQPGQPCNLCNADAYNGPQDCPLVAIVMGDEQLRSSLDEKRLPTLLRASDSSASRAEVKLESVSSVGYFASPADC